MSDRSMGPPSDRRVFLRRMAALGVGGASVSLLACGTAEDGSEVGARADTPIEPISRPLLLPWSEDTVRIAAPVAELPVTYVSMASRRVFVDLEFRDRASWLLSAHISVSTALWRIPLPGDPPGQPITPGDELREFEEVGIRDWDPAMPPAEDDIRIRRGRRVTTSVDFACVPGGRVGGTSAGPEWFSAGPWPIDLCSGGLEETTREDFMLVGTGKRHRTRSCDDSGETVRFISWACRDATSPG